LRNKADRQERVRQALVDAGLNPPEIYLDRFPHQLSGGQRQRVVIAGALVLDPILLLADEPVSMLDVSIRAEILNLLIDLRARRGISILFITHDLATAAHFTDRVAVMYLGRIVEIGPTEVVLKDPQHPYTRALLSVVPVPNPRLRKDRLILQGETPNAVVIPSGCRFHPRCPVAFEECKSIDPPEVSLGDDHWAACLRVKG
jgi:oligopeptide/dipeptide ABC transporter ATP-binding protein